MKRTTLAALPPLALIVGYARTHTEATEVGSFRFPFATLLDRLVTGRCWNGLGVEGEATVSTILAITFLLGAALLFATVGRRAFRREPIQQAFWLLPVVGGCLAYFILPDAMAGGFKLSSRLLLLTMLFIACALAASNLPGKLLLPLVVVIVCADAFHLRMQYRASRSLGQEAAELVALVPSIGDKAVLLPVNYSTNWMHSNLSNYIGASKDHILVLDHFIAANAFAPVQWNPGWGDPTVIGDFATSNRPCIRIDGLVRNTSVAVNTVLTWKMDSVQADSCQADLLVQLGKGFDLVGVSPHRDAELFKTQRY